MARLVSLQLLQTRVGQRAGMRFASSAAIIESGAPGQTSELTDDINEGIAELYDLFTQVEGQPWYLQSTTFNTVNGTDTYNIGAGQTINITDFYKPRGLDIQFGQNIVVTARPYMWNERNRYKWYPGWIYSQPVYYRMLGKPSAVASSGLDSVKFIPMPNGQFNITLWYTPIPPLLVNSTDTFDGVNGYEEYVVLSAAIKLLLKQEQMEHAQVLMAERARQEQRILASTSTRDAENPERVQDVTLNDGWIGRPGY